MVVSLAVEEGCRLLLQSTGFACHGALGMQLVAIAHCPQRSPRGRPRSATGPRQSGTLCLAWVAR